MKRDSNRAYRDKMRRFVIGIIFSGALFLQGMTVSAQEISQNMTAGQEQGAEQNTDLDTEQNTELGTEQNAELGTEQNAESEPEDFTYYEAVVISDVNVRENAGSNYGNVIHNGKKVALPKGQEVVILSEAKVASTIWYEIRFTLDGEELTGYSSGSFIEKTGGVITPTPLPTPIPTATPVPTATPTPEPTVVADAEEEIAGTEDTQKTDDAKSNGINKKAVFLVLAGIGSIAVIVGCYMWYQKNNDEFKPEKKKKEKRPVPSYQPEKTPKTEKEEVKEQPEQPEKADNKQKAKSEKKDSHKAETAEKETSANQTLNTDSFKTVKESGIAVMKRERTSTILSQREIKPIEPVKESGETPKESQPKKEEKKETYEREWAESLRKRDTRPQFDEQEFIREYEKQTTDKQQLRKMVDELQEHDTVIHRFLGYGEVNDNSDIKLIEIRFGSDIRYFNKDSLVAKKMFVIPKKDSK